MSKGCNHHGQKCPPSQKFTQTDCGQCENSVVVEYQEQCPPKCCTKFPEGLCAKEICCRYTPAVVGVHSEFHFTTSCNPDAKPGCGLNYGENLETVYTYGNGFFIERHVIVCPAHLVLAPPDHSKAYNRWPFKCSEMNPDVFYPGKMTCANRIFVDVRDVNGSRHSYTYQCFLMGVSGVGDIALISIDPQACFNADVPCILKCHPHLRLGCSRKERCTRRIFSIGKSASAPGRLTNTCASGIQGNQWVEGTIANHRGVDYTGWAQQELLVVNLPVFGGSGLPLINEYGQVVGMQTMDLCGSCGPSATGAGACNNPAGYNGRHGEGMVAGPAAFFLNKIVAKLLNAFERKDLTFAELVNDPVGQYYRLFWAYLGLAWEVFHGKHYASYVDCEGKDRAKFDCHGNYVCDPSEKQLIGLRVVELAQGNFGAFRNDLYLPGACGAHAGSTPWLDSPLYAEGIKQNDVITHINGFELGAHDDQVPLSDVLAKYPLLSEVNILYRPHSQNYKELRSCTVNALTFSPFADYPWYKYPSFPYCELTGYSVFQNTSAAHIDGRKRLYVPSA